MSYGNVIVAAIYAMQMVICVLLALPYKRRKRDIVSLVVITMLYYYILKLTTLNTSTYWIAYVVEFFGTLLVLAIYNSGNIWRNFMISWFNFQCGNILIIIEGIIVSYFTDTKSFVIFAGEGDDKYVFVDILLMFINAMAAATLSRKIFKREYNGDGRVYRSIVAIIVTVGTVLGLKKAFMITEVREHTEDSIGIFRVYAISILIIFLIMYLVGYFYNLSEAKRLLREKDELKLIVENNYIQYENIVESNKKLEDVKEKLIKSGKITDEKISTLSLSGNLTLDSLIAMYHEEAGKNNIAFEICIPPLDSNIERDMKLATIIDNLMKLAIKTCEEYIEEKWISLGIRQNNKELIIKLEFCKPNSYKIKIKDLKLVRRIVAFSDGAINIDNKDKEVCINILLS